MDAKQWNQCIFRWALKLQEYDFNICYTSGKDNVIADALSSATSDKHNRVQYVNVNVLSFADLNFCSDKEDELQIVIEETKSRCILN